MTIKEFLDGKTLSAVELANNIIFNLVIGDAIYGIDIDSSNVPSGTVLSRISDFTIENDILKVGGIELDITTTNMLGEF